VTTPEWDGTTLRTRYDKDYQAERDAFADAARDGDWTSVFTRLDERPGLVNTWRPGGPSWYTPLHQAAWHGADPSVVRRLLTYGPWLTLRNAAGDRPLDIALRGGHRHLAGLLMPIIHHPVPTNLLARLQRHFHDLVRERVDTLVDEHRLRLPELDVLTELAEPEVWFPVPGMYGGFRFVLREQELEVESWIRVVEGSGERHRITGDGYVLVEEGFV
jgi:hypothetical protein